MYGLARRFFLHVILIVALLHIISSVMAQVRQETMKVGILPIAASLPFFTAMERGFLEEEGVRTDMQFMAGGPVILPALAGGSLDIGQSTYIAIFTSREQGFDFTILAHISSARVTPAPGSPLGVEGDSLALALEDSGIKGVKDFKGKAVALNTFRGVNEIYAYEWLQRNGINPKVDIKWLEVPFPNMGVALRTKQVDAIFTAEPFVTIERAKGGVRTVGFPFEEVSRRPVAYMGFIATAKWLEKKPDLARRFVSAFYKGIDYANAHQEDWPPLLSKYLRLDKDLAGKMKMNVWSHPIDVESLQFQSDLAQKWGLIKKIQDVRNFLFPTALK